VKLLIITVCGQGKLWVPRLPGRFHSLHNSPVTNPSGENYIIISFVCKGGPQTTSFCVSLWRPCIYSLLGKNMMCRRFRKKRMFDSIPGLKLVMQMKTKCMFLYNVLVSKRILMYCRLIKTVNYLNVQVHRLTFTIHKET